MIARDIAKISGLSALLEALQELQMLAMFQGLGLPPELQRLTGSPQLNPKLLIGPALDAVEALPIEFQKFCMEQLKEGAIPNAWVEKTKTFVEHGSPEATIDVTSSLDMEIFKVLLCFCSSRGKEIALYSLKLGGITQEQIDLKVASIHGKNN